VRISPDDTKHRPTCFPERKTPETTTRQLRAERIPDEPASLRELFADLAGSPLEREHLAKSLQREVREQREVLASAVGCRKRSPRRVDHRRLESHDPIK